MNTKEILKKVLSLLIIGALIFVGVKLLQNSQNDGGGGGTVDPDPTPTEQVIDENGFFDSKEDVALYIETYGHLPSNYITKAEARKAGWSSGDVEKYVGEGYAIGGDTFSNREGNLPKKDASGNKITYIECDIDTVGKSSRGAKRIVFASDGSAIYYTEDHYETFEQLYGGQ